MPFSTLRGRNGYFFIDKCELKVHTMDMKRNITSVAQAAKISRRHMHYLLDGERAASAQVARRLEKITGIKKSVWVFGNKRTRMEQWLKYKRMP